ncbi:hypothetical protein RDI58_019538 [Solanum bulbocastanum]|uniref:Cation/H(+) antiporter central domain-containing protein n=1 Tax=Solanum bulbocastanum TaxID=147425 RepID=A0AAN8TAT4_SOLBU
MINLIEASRGTATKEGLRFYAMHLMELSERSSAILMVHKARKNGLPFWTKGGVSDSNQIVVAFEMFENLSKRIDGHLETTRADLRHVNRRVLQHAPCSVGILVDQGFGGASHVSASNVDFKVTILFLGGHDDREALA